MDRQGIQGIVEVAVTSEDTVRGTKIVDIRKRDELIKMLAAIIPSNLTVDDVFFVCIGTDRSTGDALGPLAGMMLESAGYTNVLGTVDHPVHGENLPRIVANLPSDKVIIAIDAALGAKKYVGSFTVSKGPIKPGTGVYKDHLPEVGDYSITGVVNTGGLMPHLVLSHTRLSLVYRMAADIASALIEIFPKGDVTYGRKRVKRKVFA